MSQYAPSGNLVTDIREIATSETWESQSDWEAYQERNNIEIDGETLILAPPSLPESVVHYWPFDEGSGSIAENTEGSGDLDLNGPSWRSDSDSIGGERLEFDGDSDYADATAETPSGDKTIAFTLEPISIGTTEWVVNWGRGDTEGNINFQYNDGDEMQFSARDDSGNDPNLFADISTGTRYRVLATMDHSEEEYILYMNGSAEDSTTTPDGYSTTENNLQIGRRPVDHNQHAEFFIDDLLVADEVWTQSEIDEDYQRQPW